MNSKYRKVQLLCLIFMLLMGCGTQTEKDPIEDMAIPSEEANELLYVTESDCITEFTDPVYIDLSEAEDGLLIEKAGDYVLSGEYDQTLTINAHDQMVHLFLDNVNMETAVGPAINIISGSKVIITLMEGSMNTIFDAAYYSDEELNGAVSSVCDLTINGAGALYVCGYYKDAVYTKDVFKMIGGSVQLKSKRYGIKGNDGMVLEPDSLVIESEKNGCQTSNHSKAGKGIIDIRDGKVNIVAGEYGLSAVSDVYIRGGELYINSVIADIYTEGQQYIAEGTVINE